MTDRQSFAKLGSGEELWNVTLLPLAPAKTKALENLDERRSEVLTPQIVAHPTSFEGQRQAVGW
jgi:hypothetical protein